MRPMFAPLNVVERLLATLYPDDHETIDSSEFKPMDSGTLETVKSSETESHSPTNVRIGTRPNRYLSDLLNSAICSGATSLYFDVINATPRVRWRVNGQLKDHDVPSTIELYDAILDQIKRLAKTDMEGSKVSASVPLTCVETDDASTRSHTYCGPRLANSLCSSYEIA